MTAESQPTPVRRRLPRAALIAIIAGGAVLALILVGVVSLAVALGSLLSLGPTAAADLRPGACLAEADANLAQYTVIDCAEEPAQQVVAQIDLGRDTAQYTTPAALDAFAQEICDRFLEYSLYVVEDIDTTRFDLVAITVPTPDDVAAGRTAARCAVAALDGSPLPGSLYRAMP